MAHIPSGREVLQTVKSWVHRGKSYDVDAHHSGRKIQNTKGEQIPGLRQEKGTALDYQKIPIRERLASTWIGKLLFKSPEPPAPLSYRPLSSESNDYSSAHPESNYIEFQASTTEASDTSYSTPPSMPVAAPETDSDHVNLAPAPSETRETAETSSDYATPSSIPVAAQKTDSDYVNLTPASETKEMAETSSDYVTPSSIPVAAQKTDSDYVNLTPASETKETAETISDYATPSSIPVAAQKTDSDYVNLTPASETKETAETISDYATPSSIPVPPSRQSLQNRDNPEQVNATNNSQNPDNVSPSYVNITIKPEFKKPTSSNVQAEVLSPEQRQSLDEEISNSLQINATTREQGRGSFGSVKMAVSKEQEMTEPSEKPKRKKLKKKDIIRGEAAPLRAMKTTLNKTQSVELELLRQLKMQPHPNIVATGRDFRSSDPVAFADDSDSTQPGYAEAFEMDFVGQSLQDVLNPEKRLGEVNPEDRQRAIQQRNLKQPPIMSSGGLPPALMKKVGKGVSSALNHLHTKTDPPILHMDLNPGNILLTADGEVKLSDFGCAMHSQKNGLLPGEFMINAFYAAPELAQGRDLSEKSEIWSLGCLLYETATGERLYDHNPIREQTAHDDATFEAFREKALNNEIINRDNNQALKNLLSQLLTLNPADRPSTAQVLQHPYLQ